MNIVIVEGKSDKFFFEYILKNVLNEDMIAVEAVNNVEVVFSDGLSKLPEKIGSEISKMSSKSSNKMGIVIDLDNEKSGGGYKNRLQNINDAIQKAFSTYFKKDVDIPKFSELQKSINFRISDKSTVEIKYHFIHLDGKGELEDILRKIKLHTSHHADCVDKGWRCCLCQKGLFKTEKEINKTWLDYYIRHDILTEAERKNASKTCNLGYVLNDENRTGTIFNFDDDCLKELKNFLKLFSTV